MFKRILLTLCLIILPVTISGQTRDLDQWYAGYNHKYFQDELPKNTEITTTLNDDRFMALTLFSHDHFHIDINLKYNISTKTQRINLLHESCHILVFVEHDDDPEFDDHGPHWQRCMHSLADQNAFNDLW
jgi:hypothetical protein